MFDKSVIPIFDSFNTFLQAEEPLIHILYHSTLHLYRSLLSRFILLEVISESDDVLSIDLEDPDVLRILTVYLLEQWPNSMQGTVTSLEPLNIINISSSAWKTPRYVRWIACVNLKVPKVNKWHECFRIRISWVSSNSRWWTSSYFDEDDKPISTDHIWHQIS